MDTLHEPPDISDDPHATPYFLRRAAVLEAVSAVAARRGLPSDPLAA